MSKWKVSDADTFFEVYRDEQSPSYSLLSESEAHRLAEELDELEALREERRWRKIGEEMPEDGQMCQMSTGGNPCPQTFNYRADDGVWGHTMIGVVTGSGDCFEGQCRFTHWRPVPVDVPKEEG